MTRCYSLFAATTLLCAALTAHAQDGPIQAQDVPAPTMAGGGVAADYGKCCKDCCCVDPCCCCSSNYYFDVEGTFFRVHHAGGIVVGDPAAVSGEFDFDAAPRLTLGYVNCDGMGARIRYWNHDSIADFTSNLLPTAYTVGVRTTNVDFEIFQEICLDCCTTLEVSAGVRYNEFDYQVASAVPRTFDSTASFDGIGGMIAVEARRDLGGCWGAYARLREVILMGDREIDNFSNGTIERIDQDVTLPVTEIAMGLDYSSCNWTVHAGVEWQNWANFDANATDIGFAGLVLGGSFSF